MSKKIGRPKTPKDKAKTVLLGAFVDPQEAKTINRAIAESGQSKSEWLRTSLVIMAKQESQKAATTPREFWATSSIRFEDLNLKTVQFKLPYQNGFWSGIGEFWVRRNRTEKLAIEIVTEETDKSGVTVQRHFPIAQPLVDKIAPHPDQSVAQYCLE